MAWIESHQTLDKNGKLLELSNILEINKYQAIGHLHALWWWSIDNAEDGNLKRFSNATVTQACGWTEYIKDERELSRVSEVTNREKDDSFVDALIKCGFLDRRDGGLFIHNWEIYTHRYFQSVTKTEKNREQVRERVRRHRRSNATVTPVKRAVTPPTIPYPTIPNQTIKTKDIENVAKDATTPQAGFVLSFKKTYEAMAGQPFKAEKQHYVMVHRLLKDHGEEAVVLKAKTLGLLCESRGSWFTKGGWSDYTLENLSRHWNSILDDIKASPEKEFLNELKKEEAKNERLNSSLNR